MRRLTWHAILFRQISQSRVRGKWKQPRDIRLGCNREAKCSGVPFQRMSPLPQWGNGCKAILKWGARRWNQQEEFFERNSYFRNIPERPRWAPLNHHGRFRIRKIEIRRFRLSLKRTVLFRHARAVSRACIGFAPPSGLSKNAPSPITQSRHDTEDLLAT